MTVFRIAGFCVAAALGLLLLRQFRPDIASAASIAAGCVLLLLATPYLAQVLTSLTDLADTGGVSETFLAQLMKVAGISLLMDFSAQTCRDAGETGLALKTELAGRIMLLTLALPAMQALLSQFMSLCA